MKKLLVVLLALVAIGALSAQVSVSFETSGDVYIAKSSAGSDPMTFIDGVDVDDDDYTIAGIGGDGAYGAKFYYNTIGDPAADVLNLNVPVLGSWKAWYKYDFGTFEIGTSGDGAFNGNLAGDLTDEWGTDGFGSGLVYISPATNGLSVSAWLHAEVDADTMTTSDALQTSGFSVQYAVENMLTISGTVLLGLIADDTKINGYVNFTGVENLNAYVDVQYDQAEVDSLFEAGAKYTMDALAVTGEFSSNWGGADFLYNGAVRVDYTINEKFALRAQGVYRNYETVGMTTADTSYDVYGKATYTIGNGLTAWGKLGYDGNDVYYQLAMGYSVAL
jgi:hypothetical protein